MVLHLGSPASQNPSISSLSPLTNLISIFSRQVENYFKALKVFYEKSRFLNFLSAHDCTDAKTSRGLNYSVIIYDEHGKRLKSELGSTGN